MVVSGEAGIGKSRLARELTERARSAGVRVATGRAVQGASQFSFRPFGEALHAVVREHGAPRDPDLAPFEAVLSPFVPAWARDESRSPQPSLVLLEGIHRLLRALGKEHGLLVVLEDLHWADADTLATLEYLADNIASERLLCLATERSGLTTQASDVLARLVSRRAATRVPLAPLTDDDVEAMARASLGVDTVPGAVVGAMRRRAEGVPFLIEEMLSAYVSAGGKPEGGAEWWLAGRVAGSLPPSFRDLVAERIALLNDAAREVLNAAAILGRAFEWPLVSVIVDRDREVVIEALRSAVGVQLLAAAGGTGAYAFSFRHALMREAVLAEMLPPERAELSFRAAEAIEDHRPGVPGEWCERVAELREQAGDSLGAVRLLQESARRALARGALGGAESSLRRAGELAKGDYVLWMGVDTLLCEVLAHAGKTKEVASTSRAVVAEWERAMRHAPNLSLARMLPGPRRAQLHLQAARAGVAGGDLDLARESLANARAASQDDETLTHVRSLEAAVAYASGDLERAASEANLAHADAERLRLRDAMFESLETAGRAMNALGDLDKAHATFERLLDAASRNRSTVWRIRALEELGALESLRLGKSGSLEDARSLAVESGAVSLVARIEIELARHRMWLMHLDEAKTFIDSALRACRPLALPSLPDALLVRATLFALEGRSREMDRVIEEARRLVDRDGIEPVALGEAHAVLALVDEDGEKAREFLDQAASSAVRHRHGSPWFLGVRGLLDVAVGDQARSPERQPSNPVLEAYRLYAEAIAKGRDKNVDEADATFAQADELMPPGWRKHHARRIVARSAIEDGWGEPAAWAREALSFFEGSGLRRMAAACKKLMRAAGVPAPRAGRGSTSVPESLATLGVTSREMDVLVLVGEGLSNANIAERLFLSPRTVETHVKSLMRRTATGSRALLVALAARHTPAAAAREGD